MEHRVLADRYRVERKLGEGGMAEVFLVHDALEDRRLALKLLKGGELSRDYFKHEFRVLARLDHPNLVAVHDFGVVEDDDGRELCYYTCEYLEGEDLFTATREMDFDGLFDVVRAVLEALAYVHDRGLVHYDVKPENISVLTRPAVRPGARPRYVVKLVDFGLTGEATTERGEKIKGTIHYVAPEVAKSLPADRRADLYSLGVTLYYVVTGALPYDGGSAISIIRKHIERAPTPPTQLRADVPEAWAGFILRLMAKDPADRYVSAPEALADLARRLGKPYEPNPMVESGIRRGDPAAAAAVGSLSPRFVGRTSLLTELAAALPAEGSSPRSVVFWIEGEEGIGKTRLVYELKVTAQLRAVPFLDAVCVKEGDPPFERLLRQALTVPGVRPLPAATEEAVRSLFPGVLGDGSGPALPADPQALGALLDRVVAVLLRAAASRPYVLVLEDIRRANEITIALLGLLLRSVASEAQAGRDPGVVAVLTDRPGGESGEMTAAAEGIPEELAGLIVEDLSELRVFLSSAGLLVSRPILRLTAPQTRDMIGSMLALADPEPEVCERVQAVTGGNPLFVEELIRSLVDDGILGLRRPVGPSDLRRLDAPRSFGDLLGRRLARMPEDTRAVLIALAVLRAPSALRTVALTAKRSVETTLDALDELDRRQMLRRNEEPGGAPPRYVLAHVQVRRSVLKSVSRRALAATHRRALAALEQQVPPGPAREEMLERLARHADRAGDAKATLEYATAAGLRAQGQGNPQQAIELLDRALELLRWEDVVQDPQERGRREAEVLLRLSEVLATVGRTKDAARALEELLSLDPGALPPHGLVAARRRLGDLAIRQGNAAEARRWLRDALAAAGDDPADPTLRRERARVLEVMSQTALWRGDYLQVIALASEAIEAHRALGEEAATQWALNVLSTAELLRGNAARASDHLRVALRLVRGSERDFAPLLTRLGCSEADAAAFDRDLRSFERSRAAVVQPVGDAFGILLSFSALGSWFDRSGEARGAVVFYEAARRSYERLGDAQRTALARNNLAVFRRHAGESAAALAELEQALAVLEGMGERRAGAVALVNVALLLLGLGDAEGAQTRARRALAIAREVGVGWLTGHAHRAIGQALVLQRSPADADRELQRAAGVFRMVGNPRALADVLLDRAQLAAESGRADEATSLLKRARDEGPPDKPTDFLCRERLVAGTVRAPHDPTRALDDMETALRLADRSAVCELELAARRGLARLCTRLGTLRLAQQHLDAAHDLGARLTAGLDPKLRDAFERTPASARARETSRLLVERSLED